MHEVKVKSQGPFFTLTDQHFDHGCRLQYNGYWYDTPLRY